MTSATTKASPFDNVANEVLDLIFSSIPSLDNSYVTYENDGSLRKIHQIIALMHVSRQFRFAILQHKVWHGIQFDFIRLATIFNDDEYDQHFYPTTTNLKSFHRCTDLPARVLKLCNVLFCDPYFREGIKRKTEWGFASLDVLFAAIAYIPTFMGSAHRVRLALEGIDVAVPRLIECRNLVELEVFGQRQCSLDLDHFRHLKSLKILKITLPEHCVGSLEDLEGLEEFYLDETHANLIRDPQSIFPMSSAETLTRMVLRSVYIDNETSLKMFKSLKHLSTQRWPFHIPLAHLIRDLPSSLCSLEAIVRPGDEIFEDTDSEDEDECIALLDCLCLAHLKKIRLSIVLMLRRDDEESWFEYIDDCMDVVTNVVKKLKLLEEVEIVGGLDLERIHILGQLPNLRRLRWFPGADKFINGVGSQDPTRQVVEVFERMDRKLELVDIKVGSKVRDMAVDPDSDEPSAYAESYDAGSSDEQSSDEE